MAKDLFGDRTMNGMRVVCHCAVLGSNPPVIVEVWAGEACCNSFWAWLTRASILFSDQDPKWQHGKVATYERDSATASSKPSLIISSIDLMA